MRQRLRGLRRALLLALVAGLLLSGCASLTSAAARRSAATVTPAPTPTAAQTIAGQLAALAQQAIGSASGRVTATYDAQQAKATLTITVTGGVPNTDAKVVAAYARVKLLCYRALAAVWSSAATAPLREVTALVLGPMQDEYAVIINDWYGFAVVGAPTAQRIHWASVSPDAAWAMYDQTMLRVSFVVAD